MLQALRSPISCLTLTPASTHRHRPRTDKWPQTNGQTHTEHMYTYIQAHVDKDAHRERERVRVSRYLVPAKKPDAMEMQPGGHPGIQPHIVLTNLVMLCRPRLCRQGVGGVILNPPLLTALQVIVDCLMAAGHPHLGGQIAGLPLRATPLLPNQRTGEFARRDGCHQAGGRICCFSACPFFNRRMSCSQLDFPHMDRRGLYLLLLGRP
jgi:hypothetical protein